jgi:UPF0176 protein
MHQVLLFYKYVTVDDAAALAATFRSLAEKYHLLGRVIVAEEGVNATLEGLTADTESFAADFLADPRFADIDIKKSAGTGDAFPRLSIKVRKEIVGTRFDPAEVDPRVRTAPRLSAAELHDWYESQRDFVVVDMRNDFEFRSGHFRDSVNPGLRASRDLPEAMPMLESLKDKTVVTVCTGGVRCEKMSAYLLSKGFKDVYQLENGIHTYMEEYPGKDFRGTLYTFDNRLVMDFGGEREIVGACRLCNATTETYVNCANLSCHLHFLVCDTCNAHEGVFCSESCKGTS